jgi:hypothetical protein
MTQERRVWAAALFPIGHAEVFGGARDRDRLHWTKEEAEKDALQLADEMSLSPIRWRVVDEFLRIGFCHRIDHEDEQWAAMVRGVLLPLGSPPE